MRRETERSNKKKNMALIRLKLEKEKHTKAILNRGLRSYVTDDDDDVLRHIYNYKW